MSFTCPKCGTTSHHPKDAEEGYCARCKDWTLPQETPVLVCAPATSMPLPGSVERKADCGHQVWIAKAGQAKLAEWPGAIQIMCVACLPLENMKPGEMAAAPGALEEMQQTMGSTFRRGVEDKMRNLGFRGV